MTQTRLATVAVLMLAFAAHAAPAQPTYRVTELHGFLPQKINNRGQILGTSPEGSVLYDNGQLTALGAGVIGVDLNDSGHVTGRAGGKAIIWREGAVQVIDSSPGFGAGINNSGWVAGLYERTVGSEAVWRPFLYDGSSFQDLLDLYVPGGAPTLSGWVSGINAAGHVAGEVTGESTRAVLFADGVMVDVGPDWANWTYAYTLNDHGQVAGITDAMDTWLYDNGVVSMVPRATGHGHMIEPVALDDSGRLLSNILTFVYTYYSPQVSVNSEAYSISAHLGSSGRDAFMIMAYDMNDRGEILAQGVARSNVRHGDKVSADDLFDDGLNWAHYYVLSPIPEPQTYALMGAGLLLLAARAARRAGGSSAGR